MSESLASWTNGATKEPIVALVERALAEVPAEERVAVFDNDGTLWCEKPLPVQADFILRRLAQMAHAEPDLRSRQPWKAAHEHDYGWLKTVLAEHSAGDETNVRTLLAGVLAAFTGITVEDFEHQSETFLRTAQHPTLGRPYLDCACAPMIELLAYLETTAFSTYIASGGERDFMRPISHEVYGIPRERVIGSATAIEWVGDDDGGAIVRRSEADYLDDGPQKPIRIWNRVGRRPLLAAGNSNGDIPMLEFTRQRDRPFLPLLLLHDDKQREFDYTAGAEQAIERAATEGWTVASIRTDWTAVFRAKATRQPVQT